LNLLQLRTRVTFAFHLDLTPFYYMAIAAPPCGISQRQSPGLHHLIQDHRSIVNLARGILTAGRSSPNGDSD